MLESLKQTDATLLDVTCCVLLHTLLDVAAQSLKPDPTLLRYASAITEQKKCWKVLAEKFDRFQNLRNNIQQHATGCANVRNT